jgi:hypothetical protein
MNTFRSSCPVVERTQETFVEHVTVGGERRRMEYTKPIIWIQESESQVQFLHGGEILKEGSTHNDWYGYLTSHRQNNPEKIAAAYSITPESSLELVQVTTVKQIPATETAVTIEQNRTQHVNYKPLYADVPDAWRKEVQNEHFPDDPKEKLYPRLEPRVLGTGITWTSKNTPEQNAELAARFIEQWAAKSIMRPGE